MQFYDKLPVYTIRKQINKPITLMNNTGLILRYIVI